jgi:uncharacterized membrane protein
MRTNAEARPVLAIERAPAEVILTGAAVAALLAQVALSAWMWGRLPERIPIHFDFAGRPDNWGGRWTILLLPLITAGLYALLGVVGRFPHAFNYPWPITAENAARQYALARGLLVALRAVLGWLFLGILAGTCWAATTGGGLPGWIPMAGVGAVLAVVAGYFVLAGRAR